MPVRFMILLFSVHMIFLGGTLLGAQDSPDFMKAREEAVRILQDLIRIDTTNPPGNETKAADYIADVLRREGIDSEIFELEKGRGSLVARLKGNGSKEPILLMGHTDVVGVERDKWTVDPFEAVIQDGYLYGRGAQDDKDMVALNLELFLLLHRANLPLARDVIYLAEAGEEGTPHVGIEFMIAEHWDRIACEFALLEGGGIPTRNGVARYVGVSTTEKVPRRMRLIARGTSGHGSRPRPDNPIARLAAAVAKVAQYQAPIRLNETTKAFFSRLAKISQADEAFLYNHIDDVVIGDMVQENFRLTNLMANSVLRTSISPTIIKGGFRRNVIPAEAEAVLDIRALPDEDIDELMAELRRVIDDPLVELIPPSPDGRPVAPPSTLDSEMFDALEDAQHEVYPEAILLPTMLTGATDAAQLRAKGVQAYGIGPMFEESEGSRAHGNDERLVVDGLEQFLEFMYRTVVKVAVSQ